MNLRDTLLRELADGRFHSGQELADSTGRSRTAIWKQIQRLQEGFGLGIDAVRGRGYRLTAPLELLDADRIRAEFGAPTQRIVDGLHVLGSVDSTNTRASADLPAESGRARVWLAEHQTAGRGRRGRSWVSTFGANLYLSLAWRFDLPMSQLTGLSLAAGVVVAETLHNLGLEGHALKWPNDVVFDGRKLAGILVDVSGEAGGPATAVIGVGINLRIPAADASAIDQPWADLAQLGVAPSRNRVAGQLIDRMVDACTTFSNGRLEDFLPRWRRFDRLRGSPVAIVRGEHVVEGVYRGIAPSGALVLEDAGGRTEHHAGEVSLRMPGAT